MKNLWFGNVGHTTRGKMESAKYRSIIQGMSARVIKKHFPGLKAEVQVQKCAKEIAANIHARMYGANVDSVASPIWNTINDTKPNVDAAILLEEGMKEDEKA